MKKETIFGSRRDRQITRKCGLERYGRGENSSTAHPGFLTIVQSHCFSNIDAMQHITEPNSHTHDGHVSLFPADALYRWIQQDNSKMILVRVMGTDRRGHAFALINDQENQELWHTAESFQDRFPLQWTTDHTSEYIIAMLNDIHCQSESFLHVTLRILNTASGDHCPLCHSNSPPSSFPLWVQCLFCSF